MDRGMLNHIVNGAVPVHPYFLQSYDCTGLRGLIALQKVVATIRILTYGLPTDTIDKYMQIAESTTHESLEHFCRVVISALGKEYACSPNTIDVAYLPQKGEACGFPGMLGSIDCMH
jgi:hypothetical protein